jgi:hypothetical protein
MRIEAFFNGIKAANEAVAMLKQSGFPKVFVDRNHNHLHEEPENLTSVSGLALESVTNNVDKRLSSLIDPSHEVNDKEEFKGISDMSYKVVVETSNENEEKLKNIIKNMGGNFRSSNVDNRLHREDVLDYAMHHVIKKL